MTDEPQRGARRGSGRIWGALAVFVGGFLVGGVVVAVAGLGGTAGSVTVVPSASASAASQPNASPSTAANGGADVLVGQSCIRAIDDAQATYDAVSGIGDAVRSLDVGRLDSIVQHVQALKNALERDGRACHATVRLPNGSLSPAPVPASPPVPSPSP